MLSGDGGDEQKISSGWQNSTARAAHASETSAPMLIHLPQERPSRAESELDRTRHCLRRVARQEKLLQSRGRALKLGVGGRSSANTVAFTVNRSAREREYQ